MTELQFAVDAATIAGNKHRRLAERVTHLERAVVLLMRHEGISMKRISDTTGIAYTDVRHWCKGGSK